jgi:ribonuclease R
MEIPPAGGTIDRIGVTPRQVNSPAELAGLIVNVEVLEYAERGEHPVGRVIEILGSPDDFGVDVEIVIRQHHLPHCFPPEVVEQARAIADSIDDAELASRRDFRGLDIVTIDGETARDFDDAVWVERLANANYALQVHIADVSHYVRPGTPIDVEARLRGTSVYFPDRAVPMLPFELSTNICSLRPQVDRLVLSALLEIDARGETVAQEFTTGVIRSVERMTYTDVHLVLEGDAAKRERYQPLVERFELMRELALLMNRKRVRRGSIDFDMPEPLIEFDEWGAMTGVSRAARNIAHRIIEEFMLAANEAVAAHLATAVPASIYRIHEKPDPKRVMDFEEVAAHFGYSLGVGAIPVQRFGVTDKRRDGGKRRHDIELAAPELKITSRQYQKLVAKIEGKPEERILSYLMLRSLKQARYATNNVGHFALAADTYTHFTSPAARGARRRSEPRPSGSGCHNSYRARTQCHRHGVFPHRAPRRRSRARAGGVEEGALYGGPRGRGFRRARHQHRQVRNLRRADRAVHRRPGAHRHPPWRRIHLPRKRAQGSRQTHKTRVFHRRPRKSSPGANRRQRTQTAIRGV